MAGWRVWAGMWAGTGLTLLDVAAVVASPSNIEPTC
jgi:hypothetical protein